MSEQIIYLMSNGGGKAYPDNTLTKFRNKFPAPLEINNKYEIGVQAFGFSSLFKNIKTPINKTLPSLIITDCQRRAKVGSCVFYGARGCEGIITFDFLSRKTQCGLEVTNDASGRTCLQSAIMHRRICSNDGGCTNDNQTAGSRPTDVGPTSNNSTDCTYWFYYLDSDSYFGPNELEDLKRQIRGDTGLVLTYEDGRLMFDNNKDDQRSQRYLFIMFHPTFQETFKFQRALDFKSYMKALGVEGHPYLVTMDGKMRTERIATYRYTKYFVYQVAKAYIRPDAFIDHRIISAKISLDRPNYPKYIKIMSEQIVPQILNSTFSSVLLIFSPDYKLNERYTFREIEAIDFVPLLNSTISEFSIKVVDENDQQLDLVSGHATVVKLILKEMPIDKTSFNVRLTSSQSIEYTDNSSSRFRVQLPTPLNLNENWRVAINSISHPTTFATFLNEQEHRIFFYKTEEDAVIYKHIFQKGHIYSETELARELDTFLRTKNIGSCSYVLDRMQMLFSKTGKLAISDSAARVLGFSRKSVKEKQVFSFLDKSSLDFNKSTGEFLLRGDYKPNLSIMSPNYIMIYSDIVKSTIVGGEFTKLLRIAPIKQSELGYSITEFRNKEKYELDHYEIKSIDIMLCAHDGDLIDFVSNQEVIINLEFSNYLD